MNRRQFVKKSLAALLVAGAGGYGFFNTDIRFTGIAEADQSFTRPLPVPPLLENLSAEAGKARFALKVQRGSRSFLTGITTPTMGYNGDYLGPTIRVKDGQQFHADIDNTLDQPTTVHWHGLHLPAKWDGGPRQVIPAGAHWNPEFTIKQPAATLWYHPHAMGLTGEQVYNGLAGLFIIDDDVSESVDIPKQYGRDDFPLIIQDRRFFADGQFAYAQNMMDVMHGVIGNHLLVNGVEKPFLDVPRGKVRFRVVNGSNSTIYRIYFADERPFHQIATDGGLMEKPVTLTSLLLSPGERAEIIVDFADHNPATGATLLVKQFNGQLFEAMRFTVSGTAGENTDLPGILTSINWLKESDAVRTRTFAMETMGMGMMGGGGLTINGKHMDLNRTDEIVKLGTTEIWEIRNVSGMMMGMPHSMHLHDVQFQILDRNGRTPEPREWGRKDTVLVMPGEVVRIIVRFADYTGIYMYHCHLLEHEDNGMMGQFEIES